MQQSIDQEKDCESGFEKMETTYLTDLYSFDYDIPVCIYDGLKINFTDLLG